MFIYSVYIYIFINIHGYIEGFFVYDVNNVYAYGAEGYVSRKGIQQIDKSKNILIKLKKKKKNETFSCWIIGQYLITTKNKIKI